MKENKESLTFSTGEYISYIIGILFRITIYSSTIAYIYFSCSSIHHIPLAEITMGELSFYVFKIAFAFYLIRRFFKWPAQQIFLYWGWFAIYGSFLFGIIYLLYASFKLKNDTANLILGSLIVILVLFGAISETLKKNNSSVKND